MIQTLPRVSGRDGSGLVTYVLPSETGSSDTRLVAQRVDGSGVPVGPAFELAYANYPDRVRSWDGVWTGTHWMVGVASYDSPLTRIAVDGSVIGTRDIGISSAFGFRMVWSTTLGAVAYDTGSSLLVLGDGTAPGGATVPASRDVFELTAREDGGVAILEQPHLQPVVVRQLSPTGSLEPGSTSLGLAADLPRPAADGWGNDVVLVLGREITGGYALEIVRASAPSSRIRLGEWSDSFSADANRVLGMDVAVRGDTALVVWVEREEGERAGRLYAARVSVGGWRALEPRVDLLGGPVATGTPSVAWTADDRAVVAWTDQRYGSPDPWVGGITFPPCE